VYLLFQLLGAIGRQPAQGKNLSPYPKRKKERKNWGRRRSRESDDGDNLTNV
jgi:hypothetical protein